LQEREEGLIGLFSIFFFSITLKTKRVKEYNFSSPQPSPAGEGVRERHNLLLIYNHKLV